MTRRAFTLIEVLAAIALLLVLSGSLMSFGAALLDRADWTARTVNDLRACGIVFDRVSTALRTCEVGGGSAGPGVSGDSSSITVLCRSEPGGRSDLARLRLSFDRGAGTLAFAFGDAQDTPAEELLSDRVQSVRIRYYDGRAWRDSFDSRDADALPAAVEVSVWLGAPTTPSNANANANADGFPSREPDRKRLFAIPDAGVGGAST